MNSRPKTDRAADANVPGASFADIAQAILNPGGLLAQAEESWKRAVASDPENVAAVRMLAGVYRGRGDLEAAAAAYRRLGELMPDDAQAHFLCAILSGREPTATAAAAPNDGWPTPFVRVENFLAQAERETVLELALTHLDQLEAATVGGGRVDLEYRSSWVLAKKVDALLPWFLPRVTALLPHVLPRLQITPFPIHDIELQMTLHRSGGMYKPHKDTGRKETNSRRVSYVYYFHRVPKRFTGGDLLLYDTNVQGDGYAAAFTRIEVVDNSIIFFPSAYYHQITTVRCETEEPALGRFSLNGWVHAEPAGVV